MRAVREIVERREDGALQEEPYGPVIETGVVVGLWNPY